MAFKEKMDDTKCRSGQDGAEGFKMLSTMAYVAYLNGHTDMGNIMASLLTSLERSSRILRVEEERRMNPKLEALLHEYKNVIYLGSVEPYRKDVTNSTPFGLMAADKTISQHMQEFRTVVSETMDYLLSDRGIATLIRNDVFEDLMHEASYGKDQEILDSMASGMLKGIARIRKNPKAVSNQEYSCVKLLKENLQMNGFASREMRDALSEAWNSV